MTTDVKRKWYNLILKDAAKNGGDPKAACSRIAQRIRNDEAAAMEFVRDVADWALRALESECFTRYGAVAMGSPAEPGRSWRKRPEIQATLKNNPWRAEIAVGASGRRVAVGDTTAQDWRTLHGLDKRRSETFAEKASDAWHISRYLTETGQCLEEAYPAMGPDLKRRVARYTGLDLEEAKVA